MQVGFSNIIQFYITWGSGILPLALIWVLFSRETLIVSNTTTSVITSTKVKLRILGLVMIGLFLSLGGLRSQDFNLLQSSQSVFCLSKLSIVVCWFIGLFIIFIASLNLDSKFSNSNLTTNSIISLIYVWQVACSTGHPIVLLICLEINLLLFLIICLEDNFSEGVLLNVILLTWMGAFASVLAFFGLNLISSTTQFSGLNVLWVSVLLLKFIIVPAQAALFGIYQRWTAYGLVMYLTCYYMPVLYFMLPLLTFLSFIPSIISVLIACLFTALLIVLISQFESTSSPLKTMALSSIITLVILLTSTLLV